MPNVPNAPGVPALTSFATGRIALLTADAALQIGRALQPQWGIYLDGAPVIASSLAAMLGVGGITSSLNSISSLFGGPNIDDQFSIVGFDYKQDWTIADYPVEKGEFQSYDKVQLPFDVRVRAAAGGSLSNRQALIDRAQAAANTLNLYDVYTPERVYESCNVRHVDYRRTASNGVGLVVVDIWLVEIRVTATAQFSSTQQAPNASPQALGNVQPATGPLPAAPQSWADGGIS